MNSFDSNKLQNAETLQANLDALLRTAKHNERKQLNFQEYELTLLNSADLLDLFRIILEQHRERFQLAAVTLLLLDPEYEFQRLIGSKELASWQSQLLFTDKEQILNQYFSLRRKPRLSRFAAHSHQRLFPNNHVLKSVAILPLIRHNKLIGCLNLGSRNIERFQADMGTQFLQHLAAVLSACLDNARLQENIKQIGLMDPLTGINNRRFFDQRVDEEVTLALRNNSPLSCLFLDLDHFKRVNDTHGHQAGDAVLQQAAHIFNDIMRTSDVLARYGGEEFVILLANTDSEIAYDIAERIRASIDKTHFDIGSKTPLKITLSIGLTTMNAHSSLKTTQQLIHAADQAVYAAKLLGRNRVHQSKEA
ncbi:MAG: sensor domain-containing diguanylate cyclase [Piscirickettsiaceae bacterium]|nr:sensor domain-containing diguanylate cyclase [Piscirickettsiaceae bacterium]